jgi:transcriptional regulator with XRE-family HTH domain
VESLSKIIARGIREQRRRRGLSQLALAERADLSIDHISKVERGLRDPRLSVVDRVARALGVDAADLLGQGVRG